MFGEKKPDRSIRFQKQNFQFRLKLARNFKRSNRQIPDNKLDLVLSKFKLNSWWFKFFLIGFVLGLIYLVYIPNFIYVKKIYINGLGENLKIKTVSEIEQYLQNKKFLPQNNLLLLSRNRLKYFLESKIYIAEVQNLKKRWPNAIEINLLPRTEAFVIHSENQNLLLSKDGIIIKSLDAENLGNKISAIKPIQLSSKTNYYPGQKIADFEIISKINELKFGLPSTVKSEIEKFEFLNFESFTWTIYLKNNWVLLINPENDIDTTLKQLTAVIKNLTFSEKTDLYYIDLRFNNKAYLCLKSEVCSKQSPGQGEATASATSLLEIKKYDE